MDTTLGNGLNLLAGVVNTLFLTGFWPGVFVVALVLFGIISLLNGKAGKILQVVLLLVALGAAIKAIGIL